MLKYEMLYLNRRLTFSVSILSARYNCIWITVIILFRRLWFGERGAASLLSGILFFCFWFWFFFKEILAAYYSHCLSSSRGCAETHILLGYWTQEEVRQSVLGLKIASWEQRVRGKWMLCRWKERANSSSKLIRELCLKLFCRPRTQLFLSDPSLDIFRVCPSHKLKNECFFLNN